MAGNVKIGQMPYKQGKKATLWYTDQPKYLSWSTDKPKQ